MQAPPAPSADAGPSPPSELPASQRAGLLAGLLPRLQALGLGLVLLVLLCEGGLRLLAAVIEARHAQATRALPRAAGEIVVLCLGESTTSEPEHGSWPDQLQTLLTERFPQHRYRVVNGGVNRANSRVLISGLQSRLDELAPDVVIAMMGANDLGRFVPFAGLPGTQRIESLQWSATYRLYRLLSHELRKTQDARNEAALDNAGDDLEPAAQLIEKGQEMAGRCRYKKAVSLLKEAIDLDPSDVMPYVLLGELYMFSLKQVSEGVVWLEKARRVDPTCMDPDIDLAFFHDHEGRADVAHRYMQAALKRDWRSLLRRRQPFNLVLDDCLRTGDRATAERAIKYVLDNLPDDPDMLASVAGYYYRCGDGAGYQRTVERLDKLQQSHVHPKTRHYYRSLLRKTRERGIRLVCMQYPTWSASLLERYFDVPEQVTFVSNEEPFRTLVHQGRYSDIFSDNCYGTFGHGTALGNNLIARNVVEVLARSCLDASGAALPLGAF